MISTSRISSILVIAGPAHGDILLMTPLMRALREAFPHSVMDVLVYQGQSAILDGNPDVNDVISVSKHPGLAEYRGLLRRIFRSYDLAISNKQTDRAITYAWVAGRERIAVVPGDRQRWKRRLMQGFVVYDHDDTHTLLQNNALGELLGVEARYDVRLPEAADSVSIVDDLLPAPRDRPFAVLHVSPGLPHKRWTTAGWMAVAESLAWRDVPVVLTGDGSDTEQAYVQPIESRMTGQVLNVAGKLRFADVSELLSRCAVYIGTDTVTTHMAATAGVPTIALFGPESSRVWGPWPQGYAEPHSPWQIGGGEQRVRNVRLLQSDLPCPTCRPGYCLRRSERNRSCTLMQTLGERQVTDAVSEILDCESANAGR